MGLKVELFVFVNKMREGGREGGGRSLSVDGKGGYLM